MSIRSPHRRHTTVLASLVLVAGVAAGLAACATSARSPITGSQRALALFDENCAGCHGDAGRGDGAARIGLSVRPRNFRDEDFRYVSAPGGPATDEDLVATIRHGRTAGGMPAFPYLSHDEALELASLVRGIRRDGLRAQLAEELADEELDAEELGEIADDRVEPGDAEPVPGPGLKFRPDTARGRELYTASCASCHGPSGRGDGLDLPVDANGRPITVRDLTSGSFRGGTHPEEVFQRIRCGVPGTPMPSADSLNDEEIWQLVHYVELLAARR